MCFPGVLLRLSSGTVKGTQFKLGLSVPIRLFCDDDDDDDDTTEGAFPEEKNKRHIQLSKTPGAR